VASNGRHHGPKVSFGNQQSLANIEKDISSIKQILEDRHEDGYWAQWTIYAPMLTSCLSTRRADPDAKEYELQFIDVKNQLQAIHVDCLGIANAKRLELTAIHDKIKSFAHSSNWLDKNYNDLEILIKEPVPALQVYLTACHVGFVSAALLNELPNSKAPARANLSAWKQKALTFGCGCRILEKRPLRRRASCAGHSRGNGGITSRKSD